MSPEQDGLGIVMSLVTRIAGISLSANKRTMVENRLSKRLRTLALDMNAYAQLVKESRTEQTVLLDLICTNHTYWWREHNHFLDLKNRVFPALAQRGNQQDSVRIWSAGTSTGDEAYSIALCLLKSSSILDTSKAMILGTDISTRALASARLGYYNDEAVSRLDSTDHNLALAEGPRQGEQQWEVRPELKQFVRFARLNLLDPWPMNGPFDVIFCRNVFIYFDIPTRTKILERFLPLLAPHGTLYLGHSENLTAEVSGLNGLGPAIYVREHGFRNLL
jgi:chemotaxis protein methyltransferase CheR